MSFKNIPSELTELKQWVCWKREERKLPNGEIKVTKVPYNPRGFRASTKKPKHWSTFETCVDAFYDLDTEFEGIGFVFTKEDDFIGTDLDKVRGEDGKWTKEALEIINTLDSYTEQSPSGKGLHIITKGKLPGPGHCDKENGKEMYEHSRYFTFTGKIIKGKNKIKKRVNAITEYYETWFSRDTQVVDVPDFEFDESAPIIKLSQTGISQSTIALIKTGEGMGEFTTDDGQPDRSMAIFFACKELVNAGVNKESILRILTNKNYFLSEAALERRGNRRSAMQWVWSYTLGKIVYEYELFADMFEDLEDEITSIESEAEDQNGEDEYVEKDDLDQIEEDNEKVKGKYKKGAFENNALIFLKDNPLIRFQEDYYLWNSKYWQIHDEELVSRDVQRALKGKGFSMSDINNTITSVKRFSTVSNFKPSPTHIAFDNGVIDLKGWDKGEMDLKLMGHNKKHKTMSALNFDYDPKAECPRWIRFLNQIFEEDQERVQLLQQSIGYFLVYDYRWHKILVMVNKSRSGKGTIIKIIRDLVGKDVFRATTLNHLGKDHSLDELQRAKVAVISDAKQANKFNISQTHENLLTISSNDEVPVTRKFKSSLSVALPCRLVLVANDLPRFVDSADALFNRYNTLPFNVSFAGREDVNLLKKLRRELPGIFNWAIEGLKLLVENGKFIVPAAGQEKAEELKIYNNPLGTFVNNIMVKTNDPKDVVNVTDLYDIYCRFCKAVGVYTMVKVDFSRKLPSVAPWLKRGRSRDKNKIVSRVFIGIKIDTDALDEYLDSQSLF